MNEVATELHQTLTVKSLPLNLGWCALTESWRATLNKNTVGIFKEPVKFIVPRLNDIDRKKSYNS